LRTSAFHAYLPYTQKLTRQRIFIVYRGFPLLSIQL